MPHLPQPNKKMRPCPSDGVLITPINSAPSQEKKLFLVLGEPAPPGYAYV